MKYSLLSVAALVMLWAGHLHAVPVQATVTRQAGKVSSQDPAGKNHLLNVGSTVAEGWLVITRPRAEVALRGVPGTRLALAENSQVRIVGIDLGQAGGRVAQRTMKLELIRGAIQCVVEPGKSGTTTFDAVTPQGRLSTNALAAAIRCSKDVTEITTVGGQATVTPNGASNVAMLSPNYLRIGPGGIELIDLKTARTSIFDLTGRSTGERAASRHELAAGRGQLATVASELRAAVAEGTISNGFASSIATILKDANTALSAAGLAPVDTATSGAGTTASGGGSTLPAVGGAPGSTAANPANLSGLVRSQEQ